MLEKPNIPDEKIIARLRASYGIPVAGFDFLPLGNDASAWLYRVRADDRLVYFLKVKQGSVYQPSVLVPRYLKDSGMAQVVAPLPTISQELWTPLDDFTLLLYPFIDGDTGMEAGMSDSQWIEFGSVLKAIHSQQLSSLVIEHVSKETFSLNPKWISIIRTLQKNIYEMDYDDTFERELAAFWKEKREEIRAIVDRAQDLGHLQQQTSAPFVLCHADIHTANILLDRNGKVCVVDWDQPILAPKERDLMFVVGSRVDTAVEPTEAAFFRGYGKADIDWVAIAYYRYEWVVQEFSDYGERTFFMPERGAETRSDAVRSFHQLFQLGDVVEAAYAADMKIHHAAAR